MAKYRVVQAQSWEEVEAVALVVNSCIRLTGSNWQGAKRTWEEFAQGGDVVYFLVQDAYVPHNIQGYCRLFRVNRSKYLPSTYVLDFVKPSDYEIVMLVARALEGSVLVKMFSAPGDVFVSAWPRVSVVLPAVEQFPYRLRSAGETDYLVVPTGRVAPVVRQYDY